MAKFEIISNDNSQGPHVLVYVTADENPTRGDVHGLKGAGRNLAKLLEGSFTYLEEQHLYAMYPGERSVKKLLGNFFEDFGTPDVLIGPDLLDISGMLWRTPPLMEVQEINECLSYEYAKSDTIVAHHLTEEMLQQEGKIFDQAYPELPRPLIGVLTAGYINNSPAFVKKLVGCAATYPQATIFLCGSLRTTPPEFFSIESTIKAEIKKSGLEERIKFEKYNFWQKSQNNDTDYNPYVGLLDRADHLLVTGYSMSMVSEVLATGKTPILFEGQHQYKTLTIEGDVKDFFNSDENSPFETEKIRPINITAKVAEGLAEKFRKTAQKKMQSGDESQLQIRQKIKGWKISV